MNKKFIVISLLACFILQQEIHGYYGGGNFGGGFATGALVGTGVALAATSGSRAPRDPYYDVERAKANQELREMRAQDRIRREEERQARIQQREDERQERDHQRRLKQKQRDHEKKRSNYEEKEIIATKKKPKHQEQISVTSQKKPQIIQSPEELQLEIKKLELEIAQLKHSQATTT